MCNLWGGKGGVRRTHPHPESSIKTKTLTDRRKGPASRSGFYKSPVVHGGKRL